MVYHNSRQSRGVRCYAPLWIAPKGAGTAALQDASAPNPIRLAKRSLSGSSGVERLG